MAGVGELLYNIVFKSNTTTLKDVVKGISKLSVESALSAYGLDQVYMKLLQLTQEAVHFTTSLTDMSLQSGLSTQALEEWGRIAERVGGNAQELQSFIMGVSKSLYELQRHGTPISWRNSIGTLFSQAGYMGMNGLDFNKISPERLVQVLKEGYSKLDKAGRTSFATTMNANDSTLRYMATPDSQIAKDQDIEFQRQGQKAVFEDLNKSWKDFAITFDAVKRDLSEFAVLITGISGALKAFVDVGRGKPFEALKDITPQVLQKGIGDMVVNFHLTGKAVKEDAQEIVAVLDSWWKKQCQEVQSSMFGKEKSS